MKCYICGTELIPTTVTHDGKEIPAMACPRCNEDYTIIVKAEDLIKAEGGEADVE